MLIYWPVSHNDPLIHFFIVSYKDAINYEKKVEESNSSTDEYQSQRKKKPKQNRDFVEMESSSDSDICIPLPPKLRKENVFDAIQISSPVANEGESHNTSSDDTRSITSTELMPPPPPPINATDMIVERTNEDIENAEIIFDNAATVPETQNWDIQISTNDHITVKLDQILKQTVENRILLERVMMNCISNSGSCDTGPLHYDTVPSPFKAYSDLSIYDEKLSESENMQNQLSNVFTVCGGATYKENIIRGLKKIFKDKLAKKCSWLGRKSNYAVGNLKCIDILRVAVRKNFPSLRDKEFETTVANWLRQASLRYRRQKSRGV
nr:unnamed protein product [Callosobruchus analis]